MRASSRAFIGREAELGRLDAGLDEAREAGLAVVLIVGEAGIGKSRLVREWSERLHPGSATVVVGRCLDLADGRDPYGPFRDIVRIALGLARGADGPATAVPSADPAGLLEAFGPAVPRAAPAHESATDPILGQARLFRAIADLLAAVARDVLLVLVIEDVHWLDGASRDLIRYLLHALRAEPILVVLTLRSGGAEPDPTVVASLAEILRLERIERLELERLTVAEVAAQLEGLLGRPADPAFVRNVHRRSDGNPFFTEEVVALGIAESSGVPPGLRDLLLARLVSLPTDTQAVLDAAAAAGRSVAHDDLAAVVGLEPRRLAAAIRAAADAHFVVPDDIDGRPGYAFRHSLIGDALSSEQTTAERRDWHLRWAQALTSAGATGARAATLAEHWFQAGRLDEALPATLRAAEAAAGTFAHGEAGRLFDRAREIVEAGAAGGDGAGGFGAGGDGAAVVDLLERAALAYEASGQRQLATERLRDAIARIPPAGEAERGLRVRRELAELLSMMGSGPEALATIEEAVAMIRDPTGPEDVAVLASYAMRLNLIGRLDEAAAIARSVVDRAPGLGAPRAAARALQCLAQIEAMDHPLAGADRLRGAARAAEAAGDHDIQTQALFDVGWALARAGAYARALEADAESRAVAERLGRGDQVAPSHAGRQIDLLTRLGRWDEAEPHVAGLEPGRMRTACCWAAILRARQGRLDEARRFLAHADRLTGLGSVVRLEAMLDVPERAILARAHAVVETSAGNHDQVLDIVRAAGSLAGEEDDEAELLVLAILAAGALADRERGAARADAHVEVAGRQHERLAALLGRFAPSELPALEAAGLLAEAELGRLRGVVEPAAWAAAGDAYRALAAPERLAHCRYREAEALLARRGRRAEGVARLREAHAIVTRIGAAVLAADIDGLARRARVDLVDRPTPESQVPPPAALPADPYGLTAREREVLGLIVGGRTNREVGRILFISPKTAGVHVSNILAKLGATNRVEAAGLAHRLRLVDPVGPPVNDGSD